MVRAQLRRWLRSGAIGVAAVALVACGNGTRSGAAAGGAAAGGAAAGGAAAGGAAAGGAAAGSGSGSSPGPGANPAGGTVTATSTPAPVPTSTAGPVLAASAWSACTGAAGPGGYECASLPVPLDYRAPAGPTISIALDRRRASGARIGSLVVNPGGPGVSGVDALAGIYAQLTAQVREHFDVVGFDPRGVGRSAPVVCGDGPSLDALFHLDPAPATAAGFEALAQGYRAFDLGCAAHSGTVLGHVSTADSARDLDRIRQALGDARLSYLGFSYGTFLGATYAELFGDRVRAMVLDGALDPALSLPAVNTAQGAALDDALRRFLAGCTTGGRCAWSPGPDPAGAFAALLARVRRAPLPARGTTRNVGPSELLYGTATALYQPDPIAELGIALAGAERGDGTDLLALSDSYLGRLNSGQYRNIFEAFNAVTCLDAPAPPEPQLQAQTTADAGAGSVFAALDLASQLPCTFWPVASTGTPHPIAAPASPPIVVVGSSEDPVTPYLWAQDLADELAHGVLLTRVGAGHTAYGASGCIRTAVAAYLVDLTVPAAGATCPTDGS